MIIQNAADLTDEELAAYREGNRKFERRVVIAVAILALVSVAVLLIDQGIKKSVLDAVQQARKILTDFDLRVAEVNYGPAGTPQAGPDRKGADPGVDAGSVVVHAAPAGAVLDPAPVAAPGAPGDVAAGVADGAAGDG